MNKKIPRWAKPKLEELKRQADAIWGNSDSVHYCSSVSEWEGCLVLELGTKDNTDIPESWHWFSVGHVVPGPKRGTFEYRVKYRKNVYVEMTGWDELLKTLESDLKEYSDRMMRAVQRKLEQEIDSLPG